MFKLIEATNGNDYLANINNITHIEEIEGVGNVIYLVGGQTITTYTELNNLQTGFNN